MEKNIKDDQPMLQLDNNIIAGNYTFKLTVKDEEGQTNSTTATLIVLPGFLKSIKAMTKQLNNNDNYRKRLSSQSRSRTKYDC